MIANYYGQEIRNYEFVHTKISNVAEIYIFDKHLQ